MVHPELEGTTRTYLPMEVNSIAQYRETQHTLYNNKVYFSTISSMFVDLVDGCIAFRHVLARGGAHCGFQYILILKYV